MKYTAFLLAIALLFDQAAIGRADNLDDALLKEAHRIQKKIRARKHQVVGVLPFSLQVGDKAKVWKGGPINDNMAEYLENALVYANDLDRPLTILRTITQQAEKKIAKLDLLKADQRKKLFDTAFQTWDVPPKTLPPDVLLTGNVALSKDYKKTTVTIEGYVKGKDAPEEVYQLSFETDGVLLADCGVGFSLSRKVKTRKFTRGDMDKLMDYSSASDTNPTTTTPREPFPVEMKIYSNKKLQSLVPESGRLGSDKIESYTSTQPAVGQDVTIKIKNITDQKLGVALMVGGTSTLNGQQNWKDADLWVLEPKVEYTIKGFYTYQADKATKKVTQNVTPFKVLSETASSALFGQRGEAAGQIILYVFRSATDEAFAGFSASRSLRRPASLSRGMPTQNELIKAMNTQAKNSRGLIVKDEGIKDAKLTPNPLGQVVLTDAMLVTYFRPGEMPSEKKK